MTFNDVLEIKNGRNQKAVENPNGRYPIYGSGGVIGRADDYICDAQTVVIGRKGSINNPIFVEEPFWNVDTAFGLTAKKGILNPRYLFFFCKNYNFEKLNKTVTIPSLTKADLLQIDIDLPSLEDQSSIVQKLLAVQEIKRIRSEELIFLDSLIKARFVEMFGDSNNSKGYPIVKVQDVADIQVGVVTKPAQFYTDAKHGVKAFRSLNIGEMTVKDDDWVYFNEEGQKNNTKSILKENDLVIVRSGAPGTACVVTKQFEGSNAVDVIIAHPDIERVNPYYLCAFTNYPHGKRQIEAGTGGAAQQHFNVGKYKEMDLIYPPKEEQDHFVSFVKQVDKSKVVVQKALNKAQQLFDSLMQQYFG